MKKQNKLLWLFGLVLMVLVVLPNEVNASEITDTFIRQIAPDGKNIVLKSVVPKDDMEATFLMNGIVGKYINPVGYENTYAWCEGEGYTTCKVMFQSDDYEERWEQDLGQTVTVKGEQITYTLNATYDVPSESSIKLMEKYSSKLRDSDMDDVSLWYEIEDLSLINYYLTSVKSELWNKEAPGRALRFVKELNDITEGSDVNFYLSAEAGSQDETLMYENAYGPMIIFYGDYAYSFKEEGLYLKRVIYIPEDTADTKEAYVAAAQERINDYLGEDNDVEVSYGGLLSSLEEGSEDIDKPITSDGNYYNINVLGRAYKFYIIKGDSEKLVEPTYSGKNISTDISITSDSGNLPLDTVINASKVTSGEEYEKILGILNLDDNITYNVKLYSDAKEDYITRLDDGTFIVRIPVPEGFEGKDLAVYYVDENGNKDVYEATPVGNYVEFTTDHFSIYTLGYKTETIPNNSIKVVFDANGGKFGGDDTYTIDEWEASLYDTLRTPTREGYVFKGYFTEKTGGTKFEMILNESGIDSDSTFYAQWKKNAESDPESYIEENPKTLDNIESSIITGVLSLIILVSITIYLKI